MDEHGGDIAGGRAQGPTLGAIIAGCEKKHPGGGSNGVAGTLGLVRRSSLLFGVLESERRRRL